MFVFFVKKIKHQVIALALCDVSVPHSIVGKVHFLHELVTISS